MVAGCDDDLEFKSAWVVGNIVVDGKGEDWAEIQLEHLEKMEVSFGVANDREYLYLLIVTWNFSLIRTLQQEGITLWFDATSDKKKDFGLQVVGGLSLRHPVHPDKGVPAGRLEMAAFVGDEPFMIPPDGKFGPAAAADCGEGMCAYELKLPLARPEKGRYGVGISASSADAAVPRVWAVGEEWVAGEAWAVAAGWEAARVCRWMKRIRWVERGPSRTVIPRSVRRRWKRPRSGYR
jgi:hypothetical protein